MIEKNKNIKTYPLVIFEINTKILPESYFQIAMSFSLMSNYEIVKIISSNLQQKSTTRPLF